MHLALLSPQSHPLMKVLRTSDTCSSSIPLPYPSKRQEGPRLYLQVMYQAQYVPGVGWQGELRPYGPLQIEPSAQVLNYGQGIFEGMKAQRSAKGRVVLFRPEENAARLQAGKSGLCGSLLLGSEVNWECWCQRAE